MAKYFEKKVGIDAEQFDSSKPANQWPVGVQVNALSATGWSYGTLAEIQAPMGPGYVKIDGFPVRNLDYICTAGDGVKYNLNPTEFSIRFAIK